MFTSFLEMHLTLQLSLAAIIGFAAISEARQQEHDIGKIIFNHYYNTCFK